VCELLGCESIEDKIGVLQIVHSVVSNLDFKNFEGFYEGLVKLLIGIMRDEEEVVWYCLKILKIIFETDCNCISLFKDLQGDEILFNSVEICSTQEVNDLLFHVAEYLA